MSLNLTTTPLERKIIAEIVDRALKLLATPRSRQDLIRDITACHLNGTKLNLVGLRDARGFEFAHDVTGIIHHLDRATGTLTGGFVPRFAWTAADAAAAEKRLLEVIFERDEDD